MEEREREREREKKNCPQIIIIERWASFCQVFRIISSFYIGFSLYLSSSKESCRDILSDKNFNFGRGSIKAFAYLISV